MTTYKINQNIPGWNGIEILDKLAEYAKQVPDNGVILELGALFGRSTYALGHNKHNSVSLITIDFWPNIHLSNHTEHYFHDRTIDETESNRISNLIENEVLSSENCYGLWKYYTNEIPNLTGIRSSTLLDHQNFPNVDFIFHDAGHDYENVYNDLNHWWPKLKNNGILILDDYDNILFPELVRAVDQFILEKKCLNKMITNRNILLIKENE